MEIKEVSFRRKFNLGNYETMDIELTATLSPGEDPAAVTVALDRKTVEIRNASRVQGGKQNG